MHARTAPTRRCLSMSRHPSCSGPLTSSQCDVHQVLARAVGQAHAAAPGCCAGHARPALCRAGRASRTQCRAGHANPTLRRAGHAGAVRPGRRRRSLPSWPAAPRTPRRPPRPSCSRGWAPWAARPMRRAAVLLRRVLPTGCARVVLGCRVARARDRRLILLIVCKLQVC